MIGRQKRRSKPVVKFDPSDYHSCGRLVATKKDKSHGITGHKSTAGKPYWPKAITGLSTVAGRGGSTRSHGIIVDKFKTSRLRSGTTAYFCTLCELEVFRSFFDDDIMRMKRHMTRCPKAGLPLKDLAASPKSRGGIRSVVYSLN